MPKMTWYDWIFFILLVIGGLNWGLWGFFQYDLVAKIFGGNDTTVAKIIYDLVGISALYMLIKPFFKMGGSPAAPKPM